MRRFDLKGLCQSLNSLVTNKDSQGHWGQGRDRLRRRRAPKRGIWRRPRLEAKAGQLASLGSDVKPAGD